WRSNGKRKAAIQFPLDCESIPRSKSITTGTAGFCSSFCANYSERSQASSKCSNGALEIVRGALRHDGGEGPMINGQDGRATLPFVPDNAPQSFRVRAPD